MCSSDLKNLVRTISGKIEFRKVRFVYPDTGINAIRDFSFTLNAGGSLAIIGGTGSGKSTVAALIARMYDPSGGEILIDDVPLQDYSLKCLREQTGFVTQDVFLFSDTIRNNILFGMDDPGNEAMEQSASDADVLHNIMEDRKSTRLNSSH